ncbi:hypothetical protein B0F74_05050 [Rhodococcus hoagii]|nr:hypothetical protein [Prescottella equi]
MCSDDPAKPAIWSSAPVSDSRNSGIWSTDMSSSGAPNRAIAAFARSAGISISRSPFAVSCSAIWASRPPIAIMFAMSSASRPIDLNTSVDDFDISDPRMLNSFSASPVLSSANLPLPAAETRRLNASSPSNPSARKFVPYSCRISGSSPCMASGTR